MYTGKKNLLKWVFGRGLPFQPGNKRKEKKNEEGPLSEVLKDGQLLKTI